MRFTNFRDRFNDFFEGIGADFFGFGDSFFDFDIDFFVFFDFVVAEDDFGGFLSASVCSECRF